MSNEIQVFNFNQNEVRITVDENGCPWWVAKDVCKVLGLDNSSRAISVFEDYEKGVTISNTLGGKQEVTTVSESGLYKLIFKSRKPEAKAFQQWVFETVLPQIRKTGSYGTAPIPELTPLDYIKMLETKEYQRLALEAENKELEAKSAKQVAQIEKLTPEADYAKNVIAQHPGAAMLLSSFAKSVDCGLGPVQLYQWMRDNRILFYLDKTNVPYQNYLERGYFVLRQRVIPIKDKQTGITQERCVCTTLITVLGQQWLLWKLRQAGYKKHYSFDFGDPSISIVEGGQTQTA